MGSPSYYQADPPDPHISAEGQQFCPWRFPARNQYIMKPAYTSQAWFLSSVFYKSMITVYFEFCFHFFWFTNISEICMKFRFRIVLFIAWFSVFNRWVTLSNSFLYDVHVKKMVTLSWFLFFNYFFLSFRASDSTCARFFSSCEIENGIIRILFFLNEKGIPEQEYSVYNAVVLEGVMYEFSAFHTWIKSDSLADLCINRAQVANV